MRVCVATAGQTLTHPDRKNNFSLRGESFVFLFLSLLFVVCFRMVKVSFNSALGRKDVKNDAEILLPEDNKVSKKKTAK